MTRPATPSPASGPARPARSAGAAGRVRRLRSASLALALLAVSCATGPLVQGEARYRMGDLAGAIATWRTVPPGSPAHREAQARITRATALAARLVSQRREQAEAYRGEGRFAEAIQAYREALALAPARADLVARRNSLVRRLAGEKAAGRKRVAARLASGDIAGAYEELVVLTILDPFDIDLAEQLEALEPVRAAVARRHLEEARALAARGDLAGARASAARALDHDPQAAGAEALLAEIAGRQRAAGGGKGAAVLRRALALKEAGRPLDAIRELVRAAEANPRDAHVAAELSALRGLLRDQVEHFFVQGIRHYRAERLRAAIEQWEAVLLLEPEHEKARLYIEKARKVLEKLAGIQRDEEAGGAPAPGSRP